MRGEARDAADRGVLVPVRLQNARLPIDFRAIHTTDLDGWGGDAKSAVFRSLCKALEAKLGAPPGSARSAPQASGKSPAVSICVLPFANMSGDPEQEYFSDGITEDVITDLGKVSALSIVSRNLAFSFKGAKGGVSEIGRQVKASHVLVGSVRKAGQRVRITAQLINASNDAQLWGERYDRDLNDIFALQDEISKAIVAALKLTLLPGRKARPGAAGHDERQGLQVLSDGAAVQRHGQRAAPGNHRSSMPAGGCAGSVLCRALGDDGHRAVGDVHAQRVYGEWPRGCPARPSGSIRCWPWRMRRSARRSKAKAATRKVSRHATPALRIDPGSYEANRIAGMCSMALHRFDDAIRHFEAAAAAIETEFTAASFAMQMYEAKGDHAGAVAAGKRALARIEKVIAAEPDHGRALGYGAGVLAILGEADRAKEWIERGALLDPNNTLLLYNFVCALTRLGEYDEALELLSRIIDKSSQGMLLWFENDTDLDPIRDNPRFVDLLAKAKARYTKT